MGVKVPTKIAQIAYKIVAIQIFSTFRESYIMVLKHWDNIIEKFIFIVVDIASGR